MAHPNPDRLFTFQLYNESEDPYTMTCDDRLFTFQLDSESEDPYTTTCDELLMSNTDSVTTSIFQPEDVDSSNSLPYQDHAKPIPRPSNIPILTTWLVQPQVDNSKNHKDSLAINKAKPSCIPALKDKQCHLNTSFTNSKHSYKTKQQTAKEQSTLPLQKTTPITAHP